MAGTSSWYLTTDQWRYEAFGPQELASPLSEGRFKGEAFADCLAQAVRLGWTPGHPGFNRKPLGLADEAAADRPPPSTWATSRRRAARRHLVRQGRPAHHGMHPFAHAFTPAIASPGQARTGYDTFLTIADRFSDLARQHLGTRTDVLAVPPRRHVARRRTLICGRRNGASFITMLTLALTGCC